MESAFLRLNYRNTTVDMYVIAVLNIVMEVDRPQKQRILLEWIPMK